MCSTNWLKIGYYLRLKPIGKLVIFARKAVFLCCFICFPLTAETVTKTDAIEEAYDRMNTLIEMYDFLSRKCQIAIKVSDNVMRKNCPAFFKFMEHKFPDLMQLRGNETLRDYVKTETTKTYPAEVVVMFQRIKASTKASYFILEYAR